MEKLKSYINTFTKKAFTLGEVLLALAIVGVIAALVIPKLVITYQDRALEAGFSRELQSIKTVVSNLLVTEGVEYYENTVLIATPAAGEEADPNTLKPFFDKYLSYSRWCGTERNSDKPCLAPSYKYGNGTSVDNIPGACALLKNGAAICLYPQHHDTPLHLIIDINAAKGPNIWGRDIREFFISLPAKNDIDDGVTDIDIGFAGDPICDTNDSSKYDINFCCDFRTAGEHNYSPEFCCNLADENFIHPLLCETEVEVNECTRLLSVPTYDDRDYYDTNDVFWSDSPDGFSSPRTFYDSCIASGGGTSICKERIKNWISLVWSEFKDFWDDLEGYDHYTAEIQEKQAACCTQYAHLKDYMDYQSSNCCKFDSFASAHEALCANEDKTYDYFTIVCKIDKINNSSNPNSVDLKCLAYGTSGGRNTNLSGKFTYNGEVHSFGSIFSVESLLDYHGDDDEAKAYPLLKNITEINGNSVTIIKNPSTKLTKFQLRPIHDGHNELYSYRRYCTGADGPDDYHLTPVVIDDTHGVPYCCPDSKAVLGYAFSGGFNPEDVNLCYRTTRGYKRSGEYDFTKNYGYERPYDCEVPDCVDVQTPVNGTFYDSYNGYKYNKFQKYDIFYYSEKNVTIKNNET